MCSLNSTVRAKTLGWRQLLSKPLNLSYCHCSSFDTLQKVATTLLQLCSMQVACWAEPAPPLAAEWR